jgi:dephospho-CoA kinase
VELPIRVRFPIDTQSIMIIIGITGILGAGKGTVVDYLTEEKGFKHYSARAFITKEIEKRGLPVNRDTMTEVSNDLRKSNSPAYIIEQLYNIAELEGHNAVIESIRTSGEVEFLKSKGDFHLLSVDAPSKIRYERISTRGSETDNVSFEKFLADEEREMKSVDPNKQNIGWCVDHADYKLMNDGTVEDLQKDVDIILKKINHI